MVVPYKKDELVGFTPPPQTGLKIFKSFLFEKTPWLWDPVEISSSLTLRFKQIRYKNSLLKSFQIAK